MATSPTTTSPPGRQGAPPGRPPLLVRLGDGLARRPGRVILAGVALVLVALALAAGTMDRLLLSRFESPGSESLRVEQQLEEGFGTGKHHFLLLVTAQRGTVDDPGVVEAATALERDLASREGVAETASYWGRGGSPAMRSEDGTQALITVRMEGTVTEARTALGGISPDFTRDDEVIRVEVGGGDEVFRQAAEQAQADFLLAEAIVFPLVFVLLLVLYRRISVAALTLGMGLLSVVTTLALLRGVTYLTDVSTFAANLTLVMGVGLGVDYGLFVINRFREELARGRRVPEAVSLAVSKAGRTVLFSGLTVAVALSCLMLFPFPFLQSFAYAGVGTVLTSVFAALVILPAALAKVGHRVRPKREPDPDSGWWHSTALRMMRRPLLWGLPALAVVLVLAAPAVGLDFGLPDARVLPQGASSRDVQDQIGANFVQEEMDAVQVLVDVPGREAEADVISAYAADLSRVEGVYQVDALTGRFSGGERTDGAEPRAQERFGSAERTWLSVVPTAGALEDVEDLIDRVRDVPAPGETRIGGYPADLTDFREALLGQVPLVFGLILAITFVILFLMTGSILLPAKAIVLNVLSLAVMFGVMVWIFQEGNLSGLLGFTANGTLETTFPILMFCIAFGLSMDYEVFMMSRIKEEYDLTGDNTRAVAAGLQRSGPLVTAAAVILAASFAAYAVSDVLYLMMLAVGMAVVILVDATLIRGVLVPVFMRLAGRANWWAPAPLKRVHARFGVSE
ncbi:MMPL family transporter [Nocardiopsis dassonvillei]|uniref:Drug exporter of the RND superfamily-like protein n=1 Tax=Nocardiopsis dassonvillei (strain ATCC 23218 / DSM 43111 / CIP 107115 / JCM 7437 / KCTC 9190 / NBRC 14626 / NCTC 10488 / NRRL B-5397 / IMRU 509) TaxID=446468 RepID=D7AZY2_NOCDD|nr:MMPL family transporter [Nocardiopsis dassonvillei]ADH68253.1 drug exporter of the RND superfamily-like protein [Nocardiopsis dassonvillei subsp. dassonvillei DSM 43111]NKY78344.1 MMPL family transporter [Nocardiopsis dassonvillei]VEI88757.1 Putative membrane protein ydgH [Nocardiopsis dassonvillei]